MGMTIGVIPARAGSKGIPGKNVRFLAGRPLIQYAIECSLNVSRIDRTVVSTESPETAELAQRLGAEVPFLRPAGLAGDETPMLDVLEHAVLELEAQGGAVARVVLLQPTAPLRRVPQVEAALDLIDETGCDSVVSVVPIPAHYSPDYAMSIVDGRLQHFLPAGERVTRRQDARPAYSRDGTVYVTKRDVLIDKRSIYGDDCRPLLIDDGASVNLDTLEDWAEAERLLRGADLG